jgi:hypothetical protein
MRYSYNDIHHWWLFQYNRYLLNIYQSY